MCNWARSGKNGTGELKRSFFLARCCFVLPKYTFICFFEFSIFVVAAEFSCTTFSLLTLSCLMFVS